MCCLSTVMVPFRGEKHFKSHPHIMPVRCFFQNLWRAPLFLIHFPILSFVYSLVFVSIEKIYQPLAFHRLSKHVIKTTPLLVVFLTLFLDAPMKLSLAFGILPSSWCLFTFCYTYSVMRYFVLPVSWTTSTKSPSNIWQTKFWKLRCLHLFIE